MGTNRYIHGLPCYSPPLREQYNPILYPGVQGNPVGVRYIGEGEPGPGGMDLFTVQPLSQYRGIPVYTPLGPVTPMNSMVVVSQGMGAPRGSIVYRGGNPCPGCMFQLYTPLGGGMWSDTVYYTL